MRSRPVEITGATAHPHKQIIEDFLSCVEIGKFRHYGLLPISYYNFFLHFVLRVI